MVKSDSFNDKLNFCLAATAAGDKTAFQEIYTLTAPKLNAIIKGMIRDEALTHDILQQAYIAIWKNAATFDPEKGKAFTWILVITRRKALDMIRSRKRLSVLEELSEHIPDDRMESDLAAKALLLRRIIAPHLANLSDNSREAVILSAVYGLSSREIGEKYGVPTHTAKSWVRRGLQKIRRDIDVEDLHAIL